jgi:hypothetical protein
VTTVWVVLALVIVIAGIAAVSALRRGSKQPDLGAVSNQWISEHRLGQQGQDSRH